MSRTRWPPNRTLRGRLTLGLAAILLVACGVLGVATAVFLRAFLLSQLDDQLVAAGGRYSASLERGGSDHDADNAVPGQSVGTIGVRLYGGQVTQAAIVADDGTNLALALSPADTAALVALVPGDLPSTGDLAVGDYRLQAATGRDGDIQVTGLPLRAVNQTLGRLAIVEAALFGILVLTGGLSTAVVVRRTLRPLEQVSATALHVSELPLTAADTVLPGTIAPADPTSEVDKVSVAFDHMIEHVRSALAARDATEARLRRFVADASHELRTPLATIRAHAEYAGLTDGTLPVPVTDALARITAAADRMGTLVADLLLLARLDAGRPLAREPVDLARPPGTAAAVPALLRRPPPRHGRMIAVASAAASRGLPLLAAYCAAKAGVTGLVRALAVELGGTGYRSTRSAPDPRTRECWWRVPGSTACRRRPLSPGTSRWAGCSIRMRSRPPSSGWQVRAVPLSPAPLSRWTAA